MSQPPAPPAAITFIVRIWQERSLSGARWRGRIEHLQSGQHAAFEDLDRMLAFIHETGVFTGEQGSPRVMENNSRGER